MATVKAPLFGLDASGTIAKAIVFSKWKGRQYVRRHAIPANPQSVLQTGVRAVFKFVTQDYTNLSAGDKAKWDALGEADNITPLNAQIRDAIDRARRNLGWREDPEDAGADAIDAHSAFTATAAPKSIILAWTDSVDADFDYCTAIYRSSADDITGIISELIAVVAKGVLTYTDKALTTGDTWYYKVRPLDKGGKLGTLSAEAHATVA